MFNNTSDASVERSCKNTPIEHYPLCGSRAVLLHRVDADVMCTEIAIIGHRFDNRPVLQRPGVYCCRGGCVITINREGRGTGYE